MKRILEEVSVADMRGSLNQLIELLENKQFGHYWLHQLKLMLRKEPTHVITRQWLEDLSGKHYWGLAEDHFKKTKQLWFNEPEWPFQICVLGIGGMDHVSLFKKWSNRFFNTNKETGEDIKYLTSLEYNPGKKIGLIRIQAKFLELSEGSTFGDINRPHPKFKFLQCPPETAFFMRFHIDKYFDKARTIISMNFHPGNMVDESKDRYYSFKDDHGYDNRISMTSYDIHPQNNSFGGDTWWIFQYDLKL